MNHNYYKIRHTSSSQFIIYDLSFQELDPVSHILNTLDFQKKDYSHLFLVSKLADSNNGWLRISHSFLCI